MKIKKTELAIALAFLMTLALGGLSNFSQKCESIRNETLRLHIKANSDTQVDQSLKLAVRDRVVAQCASLFETSQNQQEAKTITQAHLEEMEQAAKQVVAEQGFAYDVQAKLTHMFFNTRHYEGFTLPAGFYDAVTIDIGSGQGKNWWCVLFPPLCIAPTLENPEVGQYQVTPEQEKMLEKGYDAQAQEIIKSQEKYEVKFAIIELFEQLKKEKRER